MTIERFINQASAGWTTYGTFFEERINAKNAQAQSETPKVEVGMQYTRLRLRDFDATDL